MENNNSGDFINSNKDLDDMSIEDKKAMESLLRLPSDEEVWKQEQTRRKPRYLSASLKQQQERNNEIQRNTCTNCGSTQHNVFHCAALVLNL